MQLSIRNPLTILLSLVFILALFSLPAINYFSHRDEILYGIQERELPLTADNIYSALQQDFLRPKLIAELMANDPLLIDWLNRPDSDPTSIFAMLEQRLKESNATTAFLATEKNRRYYRHDRRIEILDDKDPGDAWYFRFLRSDNIFESNIGPDHRNPANAITYLNLKIITPDKAVIGVTGLGFENRYLTKLLDNYQKQFFAQVFLVNNQGRIAISRNYVGKNGALLAELPGYEDIARQALDRRNHFFNTAHEGKQYAIQSRYIPEFEGYLFVERNIDRLLQGARRALLNNLVICTIITLISLPVILITISRYQRNLEIAASTDALTGLLNRHAFLPIVEQAVNEAQRNRQPLCLLLADIDYFKKINDNYGHLTGDQTLTAAAKALSNSLRKSDALCRWGGEEFAILLKDTDAVTGGEMAEKIRQRIADTNIATGELTLKITISIGIAEYQINESCSDWFERSDQALYEAKKSGRNCWKIAN